MGELIVLPRAERPVRPASSRDGSAEILFFTGVRYYRMTEDEMAKATQVKTRRRRRSSAPPSRCEMRIDAHA